MRELCLPLRDVDIRKFSSTLTTLANEKQKQLREKEKPKKKGTTEFNSIFLNHFEPYSLKFLPFFLGKVKPVLQTEKPDLLDTTDYGTYNDFDDDDFM